MESCTQTECSSAKRQRSQTLDDRLVGLGFDSPREGLPWTVDRLCRFQHSYRRNANAINSIRGCTRLPAAPKTFCLVRVAILRPAANLIPPTTNTESCALTPLHLPFLRQVLAVHWSAGDTERSLVSAFSACQRSKRLSPEESVEEKASHSRIHEVISLVIWHVLRSQPSA